MPRSRSSGALSISSKLVYVVDGSWSCSTFVIAAVSVVFPWSMWPIVPMFRCGFVRSNFCFDMGLPRLLCSGGYSPRMRATISWAMVSGTFWYESNCIVYVARPWVRERRSVA